MSVKTGQAKLAKAIKNLLIHWQRTKEFWHDENSRKFEQEVMRLMQAEYRKTDPAMTHIDSILNRVRDDCS